MGLPNFKATRRWFKSSWIILGAVLIMIARTSSGQAVESALKVMTFNIRYANARDGLDLWELRRDRVAEEVRTVQIVGMQEVLKRQLDDLKERIPEFEWYGVGRDDGAEGGEYSPLGFLSKRFELLEKGTFWLSPKPDEPGSRGWDAALPRIASWVRLKDRLGKDVWLIINTHFDHLGQEARLESARVILAKQKALQGDSHVVLMGDLNATPADPPYATLTREPTLKDAREVSVTPPQGSTGTWNGFLEIMPHRRIDHLFVGPTVQVQSYEVRDPRTAANRFASDHLPVVIELTARE